MYLWRMACIVMGCIVTANDEHVHPHDRQDHRAADAAERLDHARDRRLEVLVLAEQPEDAHDAEHFQHLRAKAQVDIAQPQPPPMQQQQGATLGAEAAVGGGRQLY